MTGVQRCQPTSGRLLSRWETFKWSTVGIVLGSTAGLAIVAFAILVVYPIVCFLEPWCGQ